MASEPINLTNQFLIAMPGMVDEAFAGAVVYLCEHSEKGALGLMINKPVDIRLRNLFVDFLHQTSKLYVVWVIFIVHPPQGPHSDQ